MSKPRYACVGGQAIVEAGTYHFTSATSTTWTMAPSSPLSGEDDQEYVVFHVGGDSAILTLLCGGNDWFFDPALTGTAESNSTPTNLNTLTTFKLLKGQASIIRLYNRIWTQTLIAYGTQSARVRNVAASSTFGLIDGTLRDDTTAGDHVQSLPPVANCFLNGCGLIFTLKKTVAPNKSTLKGNGAELIDGVNVIDLTAVNSAITVQAYGDASGAGIGWSVISRI